MKNKKILTLSLLFIIILLLIPCKVEAIDKYPKIDKIEYVLDESTHTAAVTDYYGDSEELEIPSQINSEGITYTVTEIKSYASLRTTIKKITIPASITSIGREVFSNCINLSYINVDAANGEYCSVDGILFNKDMTTIICYPISKTETTYNIPNTVKKIEDFAFIKCKSLKSIIIPDSVEVIGMGAFNTCSSLTNIEIPDKVTVIEQGTFYQCTSLTSVTLPKNLKSIGSSAFFNCISLEGIIFPNSLETIGNGVFSYCSKITNVTIPDSVTSIEGSTFHSCTSLVNVTLPTGLTTIPYSLFAYCSSLETITIPNSITSIDKYAFQNCTSLKRIDIPSSVTTISENVFLNCPSLVIYAENGSNIEEYAKNNNIAFAYSVKYNLVNITSTGKTEAYSMKDYTDELTAIEGYKLPKNISIKIDGIDLSTNDYEYDSKTGDLKILADKINGDIEIEANGEEVYKVIFDANGGIFSNEENTLIFDDWDPSNNIEEPTRKGYKFLGYYTAKTEGISIEQIMASEAGINSDMTFYAQWEEIEEDNDSSSNTIDGNENRNDIDSDNDIENENNKSNPNTGDNVLFFVGLSIISIGGIFVTTKFRKNAKK